jgi:hypothetical protein
MSHVRCWTVGLAGMEGRRLWRKREATRAAAVRPGVQAGRRVLSSHRPSQRPRSSRPAEPPFLGQRGPQSEWLPIVRHGLSERLRCSIDLESRQGATGRGTDAPVGRSGRVGRRSFRPLRANDGASGRRPVDCTFPVPSLTLSARHSRARAARRASLHLAAAGCLVSFSRAVALAGRAADSTPGRHR